MEEVEYIVAWNVVHSGTRNGFGHMICHLVENPVSEGHY